MAEPTGAAEGAGASRGHEKPRVLIIGGLGYLGRFLALHIHRQQLASDVRLVDKILPQLAWLAPEFDEACAKSKFIQADASREQSLPRIFDRTDGHEFDYVFNCGGDTRLSQDEEVYRLRCYNLSLNIGREAARRKVKCFVELGTGMVYKSDSVPRKETDKLKPWAKLAKIKLAAEDELAKIEGLNLVVLRLPHVYGEYSSQALATMLALARTYQFLGKEMKWLWDKDLRLNTVNVNDVSRAMWRAAQWYEQGKQGWDPAWGRVPLFNVVDHGHTSQGTMADIIGRVFSIPTGFQGALISSFARLHLDAVVDDINDEVLDPWADLLAQANIGLPGPLSPFMEKELLKDNDLSLDGSRFEKVTGFTYEKESINREEVEIMIESYRRMKWWP